MFLSYRRDDFGVNLKLWSPPQVLPNLIGVDDNSVVNYQDPFKEDRLIVGHSVSD